MRPQGDGERRAMMRLLIAVDFPIVDFVEGFLQTV